MKHLSENNLHLLPKEVTKYQYNRNKLTIGIVHLGLGAFHRAHQAIYTENVMNKFGGEWGICGVSLRNNDVQKKLQTQDNLYTLAIADTDPSFQIIGALKECLFAKDQQQAVLNRLSSSATKIVTLTITEKGYCLLPNGQLNLQHPDIAIDLKSPETPTSAIGYIVEALRLRKKSQTAPFNVLSCDNMTANGDRLKDAVVAYSNELSTNLALWIKANVAFPNSMVDSITPKTEAHLVDSVENVIGLKDEWPIQRERFSQWVIADNWQGSRPQWEDVGVIFTANVHGFETAKLRLLNGVHSSLAYIGILAGFNTVHQAITNESIQQFINKLIHNEIIGSFTPPKELNVTEYAEAILQRFFNPSIEHLLSQIAWDGSQKIPVRILPMMSDNLANNHSTLLSSFALASWFEFICQSVKNNKEINDPLAEEFKLMPELHSDDCVTVVNAFLGMATIFSDELKKDKNVAQQLVKSLSLIRTNIVAALEGILLE